MLKRKESKPVNLSVIERRKLLSTKLMSFHQNLRLSPRNARQPALCRTGLGRNRVSSRVTYLSDGWGCPGGVPIIGIPFFLTDVNIYSVVNEFIDPAPWDDAEIIRYLRHECGHTLNYATGYTKKRAGEKTLDCMRNRIKTTINPFLSIRISSDTAPVGTPRNTRNEDFAETFAVLLAPGSNWREVYADTPALPKLVYLRFDY